MDHHVPHRGLAAPWVHFPRVRADTDRQLPDLPNEMWLQIFGWATSVPGILDSDFHDSFEAGLPVYQLYGSFADEQREIRWSLVTKLSLVRVCRRWNALATPLLYQAVLVSNENLGALHRALKQAAQGAGGFLLGSLVRRVDIVSADEQNMPVLGEVFGYLSHIRIIIATSRIRRATMPESIFESIGPSCSPTLQKLIADVKHPSWGAFLGRLPNLRTLLRVQRGFCPQDLPLLPNLRFTALDSWHSECSPDCGRNAAIPFPNLEHVLLRWYEESPERQGERRACISGFLSRRAPALTTVHLETLVNVSEPVFRALAENCPHLTHIVFYYLAHETWSERPAPYLEEDGWGDESVIDDVEFDFPPDGVDDDNDNADEDEDDDDNDSDNENDAENDAENDDDENDENDVDVDDDADDGIVDQHEHEHEHMHVHEHEHEHAHVYMHEHEHDDPGDNGEVEYDPNIPPIVPKYRNGYFPLITHLALFPRDGQALNPHSSSAMFVWLAAQMPPSLQVVRFLSRRVVEDFRWRFPQALARGLEMLPGVRVEDHEGNDMRAYTEQAI